MTYPIRLTDPRLVTRLFEELESPVNANVAPGGSVADLAAAGAARISIGPMAHHVALGALEKLGATMLGRRVPDRP